MFARSASILFTLAVFWEAETSCPPCICVFGTFAMCQEKGLTQIPSGLPNTLTNLYLTNNQISTVNMTILEQFSALTNLRLDNNTLTNFQLDSRQLLNLQNLYLNFNPQLDSISINSSSLENLEIDNTSLSCLSTQQLHTPSLQSLTAKNSNISKLGLTQLTNLQNLDLRGNKDIGTINYNHTTAQLNSLTIVLDADSVDCTCCLKSLLQLSGEETSCHQYNAATGNVEGLECVGFDVKSCVGDDSLCNNGKLTRKNESVIFEKEVIYHLCILLKHNY